MSQVAISGNASGTGTLTIAAPNTNSDFTLTLPAATSTLVGTDATQTLTNKTIQGGAITSGTAVSLSGTSVDFTGIPSWAKRITVMLAGAKQNNSGANSFKFRLGTSGGVVSSGYVGSSGYFGGAPGSVASSNGFDIYFDTNTYIYSGLLTVTNISGNVWVGAGSFGQTQGYQIVVGAYVDLGAALTQLRFTTANGTNTFTAGTINIMYEG